MELTVEQRLEKRLKKQNGLLAVIGVTFWSCPIIVLWGAIYSVKPTLAGLMIPLSAALMALVVRSHGRGLSGSFKALTYQSFLLLVLTAMLFGFAIAGPVHMVVVLVLLLGGIAIAGFMHRKPLNPEEAQLYFRLTAIEESPLAQATINQWFLMLPLGLVGEVISCFIGVVILALLGLYQVH
ncbi:hypothetical protein [Gallaecimonas mangrovi]|uniref:hypothetical protein n=1 Tax=Gallaecimonas mangrovi TaxID=2291597 RepID=UPI000E2006BA|nr:hypothetical protein [Gallaecimonas mangrovi]